MPSKNKKNQKGKAAADVDDLDSVLEAAAAGNAEAADAAPAPPAAAEEAAPSAPPAATGEDAAAGGGAAAPPVDAAAAFLASMGVAKQAEGGGGKKDDKKKKKGKPKKAGGGGDDAEGGEGAAGEDAAAGGGAKKAPEKEKKMSAAGKIAAERLAKVQADMAAAEAAKAAAEAEAKAEEEAAKAAEREAERLKEEKKAKAAAKVEAAKKAGTYKTKAQKEKDKLVAARLEAMKAAGMIREEDLAGGGANRGTASKPVYGKKNNGKDKKGPAQEKAKAPESDSAAPAAAAAAEVPDSWDDEPESAAKTEEAAAAVEKEVEEEGDDDASWDAGSDDDDVAVVAIEGLEEAKAIASGEDLAVLEARKEAEELKKLDAARREREAAAAADAEAKAAARATQEAKDQAEKEAKFTKANKGKGGAGGGAAAEGEDGDAAGSGGGLSLAAKVVDTKSMSKAQLEAHTQKLEARDARKAREAANEALRTTDKLRCPIVCIMGHVDTGKTKLLDKIRRTSVQDGEAGGITQQIGATFFPGTTLQEKTNKLNKAIKMDLQLPGMLVIDTPGHEAFSNLRNRGSSLCDIAILVVDLMHGLEQQTLESIEMLRAKRCPFVVALNKVDRCYGWVECKDLEFREALALQPASTQEEFHHRMKGIRVQLMEKGLNAELYWENKELASTVSLVPTSAISGEGVNDLLHMLARLSQQRLAKHLSFSPNLQCTVLEVKVIDGLGCTVDVILVNGHLDNGATIVVCTTDGPVVTQIRALLTPPPNRELRVKSQYVHHDSLEAAVGIKICAPGLENAVAGSPIMVLTPEDNVDDLKDEVMADFAALAKGLATDPEGVFVSASTLGALEALLVFLRNECKPPIPVSALSIGPVYKRDVMRAALMHEKKKPEFATILSFDVPIDPDAMAYAAETKVQIFTADIIYHLFDQFTKHRAATLEEEKAKAVDIAVFPCVLNIMPKMVFNQKDPIICGVEVIDGILKVGTPLCIPKNGFLMVGRVASIEANNTKVQSQRKGQQCAISIVNDGNPGMTFGRQFTDEHSLYSELTRGSIDALKKHFKDEMKDDDWRLVIKLKKVFSII